MEKQTRRVWRKSQENELRVFVNTVEIGNYKNILENYASIHKDVLPEFREGISVLDVCCGPSSILSILGSANKAGNMVGIDSLIDRYLTAFNQTNNVKYITGRAEDLPFRSNCYDIALCINALDHTENWRKVIEEMVRVVKKGGKIYLDFEQTSYFERFLIKCGWKKHLAQHHIANLCVAGVVKQIKDNSTISLDKIKYEPWLSLNKIRVLMNSIFLKNKLDSRQKWEKAISSFNLSLRKKIIHYFIQLYNSVGYLFYRRPHANFIRILVTKE